MLLRYSRRTVGWWIDGRGRACDGRALIIGWDVGRSRKGENMLILRCVRAGRTPRAQIPTEPRHRRTIDASGGEENSQEAGDGGDKDTSRKGDLSFMR